MPELPELTVFADNLSKAVVGKEIVKVDYRGKKSVKVPTEELTRSMVAARIDKVQRVGKQLLVRLSNDATLFIHLMLKGGFVLTKTEELQQLDAVILAVSFADGSALALTDPRGMATVALNPKRGEQPRDGLKVTADYLQAACQRQPNKMIKALLVDQEVIGGIGNAYSDEILWRARISPKSLAGKLPPEAIDALVEAIPAVLNEAVEEIRRRRPDAVSGEVRDFLKVHGPDLKSSPNGARIIKEQIQSKVTYYTEEQKLYR
ncbi:Fpg/Nei family DNA glycosylase [Geomonas sp.]|uniref:Fpg/Nei family DNA glycosylase n=1 Tax=Geomonas sp. TaxID=2651584 RepID=UPI002B46D102|nr:DNA-formamidopyrimidine glycosylase family protein [Geomonas sp.]HJV33718.1 DNA-formamidopyrimidine glycosylase family protein [Geomonas sp.]